MSDGVQWGLDALSAVAMTFGGFILNGVRSDHRDLRRDHDNLVKELPETYARRDDVKDALRAINETQKSINEKLDRLIERGQNGRST